nr:NADH-quinone oxidoreductase subunit A [Bremerella volcania]
MEDGTRAIGPGYIGLMTELGLPVDEAELLASKDVAESNTQAQSAASKLVWTCVADIMIFFAILMVGFAYVWKRGDLDWVRSMAGHPHTSAKSKSSWRDSTQVATTP